MLKVRVVTVVLGTEYHKTASMPFPPASGLWLSGLLGPDGPPVRVTKVVYAADSEIYVAKVQLEGGRMTLPQADAYLYPRGWRRREEGRK